MKCCFIFLIGMMVSAGVAGQAKPSYTQYILNNYILNPAVAGIENYVDAKASYRNQWTGIKGAPVTTYFTIHGPIGKSDLKTSPTSFAVSGDNPRGKDYWEQYAASAPHHGIGMTLVNDKAGYINRWSVYGTYAYHQPLATRTTLSAGINLGVSSVSIDRSKIDFAGTDPNDPAIGYANSELKKIKPEMGAGLWLYGARGFAGISVLNIIPGKSKFVKSDKYGDFYSPNFFLTSGYRMNFGGDMNFIPSVMVQYWKPQLWGVHLNAKMQYLDLMWFGGGYRISDLISGYSAFAGLNLSNTINISYTYETASTSRLRNYTGNTHEVMVGFIIGNKYGDTCPRNVW
jgi:type IX secretion system PorP/SprF family membrane protein